MCTLPFPSQRPLSTLASSLVRWSVYRNASCAQRSTDCFNVAGNFQRRKQGRQQLTLQEAQPGFPVMSECLCLCVSVWAHGTREGGWAAERECGGLCLCACALCSCFCQYACLSHAQKSVFVGWEQKEVFKIRQYYHQIVFVFLKNELKGSDLFQMLLVRGVCVCMRIYMYVCMCVSVSWVVFGGSV